MTAAGGAERLEAEGKRRENGEGGGGGEAPQRQTANWRERGGGDHRGIPQFGKREREKGVGLGEGGGGTC